MHTTLHETAPPEAAPPREFALPIRGEAGKAPLSGVRCADPRGRVAA